MDSIASPPTPASVDGTSHAIAGSLSLSPVVCRLFSMLRILLKGGGDGALAHWRGNDSVRVLASARCCWRRGGDVTINIRWEVGGEVVTVGE